MAANEFSLYTDFAVVVTLSDVDASAGAAEALTGATCTAWMMNSEKVDGAKPSGAPTGTATPVTATPGDYTIEIQGSQFTPANCDTQFASPNKAFLHVRDGDDIRFVIPCVFKRNKTVKLA